MNTPLSNVIIIGAPRSGTNILRDTLSMIDCVCTWPCDEINYIWRYGNALCSHDEFTPDMANHKTRNYIINQFSKIACIHSGKYVLEKTCANSLRIDFIDKIFPNAKYLFIYRDGRDVVASERKRWKSNIDIGYILKKTRFIPWQDIPYYGMRYLKHRLYKLFSQESSLPTWGPRFVGIDEYMTDHTLIEVCAMQWKKCIRNSLDAFKKISPERIHAIQYENFVLSPQDHISKILKFLEIDFSIKNLKKVTSNITQSNIGKWETDLTVEDLSKVYPIISEELTELGYLHSNV